MRDRVFCTGAAAQDIGGGDKLEEETRDDDDDDDDDDDVTEPPTPPPPANCYSEPIAPSASVADLQAGYSSSTWLATMIEVMDRRYPSGGDLLTVMQNDPWIGSWVQTGSFGALMDSVGTTVHEETHGWDYANALFPVYFGYWVRSDWQPSIDFVEGFPRSTILPLVQGSATSLYDGTYLTGTQGTYGWMELLDEWNCYINGMAADAVIGGLLPYGVSSRDGALAFAYYAALYLGHAQTADPTTWNAICGDPDTRAFLTIQWLRMHFFLDVSNAWPALGINDAAIEALLYAPSVQQEFEACAGYTLDASPCLPAGQTISWPW